MIIKKIIEIFKILFLSAPSLEYSQKKVHYNHNGSHLCNHMVTPKKKNMTKRWKRVTCKNCLKMEIYY
jgi:RNase P subunit RPR2